ncbi:hypothetical protein CERZMDRAFT_117258 [Cercospora zeae-maydis SCOH1-5]|uniref:TNT domain-containing protein n=1 Tax=Cercospora zeae-maydis SCOH1-5 TaxID=717836 RepID=A0A6A6FJV2_9PEZI|nr:hypothetical protein CERZMDRAFT_117258 [Cercospora zeae-maydis SCOH1-5]
MSAMAAPQAEPSEEARDPDLTMSRCSNYCSGTKTAGERSLFVCGDRRLGPVAIPSGLPLSGIAGSDSTYHRFGGLCPGEFLARWTDPSGSYVYPAFDGYQLTAMGEPAMSDFTLPVGTFLDRFGSEYGKYMSPAGTPYAQRSLPPTNLVSDPGAEYPYNYRVYIVSRSLSVQGGPIAAWFEQQGLGVQFLMPMSVIELVKGGYLNRVNLTADPNWKNK